MSLKLERIESSRVSRVLMIFNRFFEAEVSSKRSNQVKQFSLWSSVFRFDQFRHIASLDLGFQGPFFKTCVTFLIFLLCSIHFKVIDNRLSSFKVKALALK